MHVFFPNCTRNLLILLIQIFPSLDNGFLGAYDPPTDFIQDILIKNRKDDNSTSPTVAPSRGRRSLLAVSTSGNPLSGISNPTTCVDYGASMMFVVDNDNYPEYDENNLYNTNPDFDSGPFRDLKERHALMNTNSTLFAFKFDSPGVYVFRSSKYPDYKMVCSFTEIFTLLFANHCEEGELNSSFL